MLQNFLKNKVFLVLHIDKNNPVALVLLYFVEFVNVNMFLSFSLSAC